jgi:hypothetical protein
LQRWLPLLHLRVEVAVAAAPLRVHRPQQAALAQVVEVAVPAVLRRQQLVVVAQAVAVVKVARAVAVVKVALAVLVQFLPFRAVQLLQRPQEDVALKVRLPRLHRLS